MRYKILFTNALLLIFILSICSCREIYEMEKIPQHTYVIDHIQLGNLANVPPVARNIKKFDLEQTDTTLKVTPVQIDSLSFEVNLKDIKALKFHRYTLDVDVLTIPFKVRPATQGFPQQLNPNFSAALYIGRRRDNYMLGKDSRNKNSKPKISGFGYGYGTFLGIGAVTMNPYVTRGMIDYEYDGFIITSGLAGIVDVKRFNVGLAVGLDMLSDKNRRAWIYQGKPWVGVLFGINLN